MDKAILPGAHVEGLSAELGVHQYLQGDLIVPAAAHSYNPGTHLTFNLLFTTKTIREHFICEKFSIRNILRLAIFI